jgi:hypothetical protein
MSKRVLLYYAPSDQLVAEEMIALLNDHDITVVSQHHFPDVISYADASGIQQVDGHIIIVSDMALKSKSIRSIIAKLGNQQEQSPLIPLYLDTPSMLQAQEYLGSYPYILWDQEDSEIAFQQVLHQLAEHPEATSPSKEHDSFVVDITQKLKEAINPTLMLSAILAFLAKLGQRLQKYQQSIFAHKEPISGKRYLLYIGPVFLISVILLTILGLHMSQNKRPLGRNTTTLPPTLTATLPATSTPIISTIPTRTTAQPTSQPTILPSHTPTATPLSLAALVSGTWQGEGIYTKNNSTFDMHLIITASGNTFTGTLEEKTYSTTVAVKGNITASGNSVAIEFTDYAYVKGGSIELNCWYTATIKNKQMNGSWYFPDDNTPDGAFSLNQL